MDEATPVPETAAVPEVEPPRKRGRPLGSKNKPKPKGAHPCPKMEAELLRSAENRTGKLTEETIQHAFALYCQLPNMTYVAKTLGVDKPHLFKLADACHWRERRAEIVARARQESDYDLSKATEDTIGMIRDMKEKIRAAMTALRAEDLPKATLIADLEKLVKLEQVLLGGVDGRSEHVVVTHEDRIRLLRKERGMIMAHPAYSPPAGVSAYEVPALTGATGAPIEEAVKIAEGTPAYGTPAGGPA